MAQTERKEMVTNDLAKGFSEAFEGLKKGPSRGLVITLALVVVGVLLFLLFQFFWNSSVATESKRWAMIDAVVFPEQFKTLSEEEELKGTTQGRVLKFMEARRKLAQGVRDLGSSDAGTRRRARKSLEEARDLYSELRQKAGALAPQLQQEALWGQAKASEALGGEADLAKAREIYVELQKDYPKSALGKDAAKQIRRLDDKDTKKELREIAQELDAK